MLSLPASVPGRGKPGVRRKPPYGPFPERGSDTGDVANRGSGPDGLPRLTAVPAARSKAAVLKVRFWVILGGLLFSAAVGLFAAVSFLTFEPAVVDVDDAKPQGLAVAELAANDFLYGGGFSVPQVPGQDSPEGSSVDVAGPLVWDGFTRYALPNGTPVEAHRFLFHRALRSGGTTGPTGEVVDQDVAYQLMELSVLVAVPLDTNPVLAARPYMSPAVYSDAELVADYSDFELAAPLPSGAAEQIGSWGKAWAEDDAEKLKLLTGDLTAGVRYVGLGGYSFAEIRVLSSSEFAEDSYLVRVRIVLTGANGSILEMDMDLTVTAASTGLPKVSGWGPAGSGLRTPADVRVSEGQ